MPLRRGRTTEVPDVSTQIVAKDLASPPLTTTSRNNVIPMSSSAAKRSSTISATSSGRHSAGSTEGTSKLSQTRPSALPRSTASSSQARLSYIASTRPMPSFAGKSPPLQALSLGPSISSIPRLDSSQSFQIHEPIHEHVTQSPSPTDYDNDTVFGIAPPEKQAVYSSNTLPPRLIPELQALAASTNRPVNPASSSISSISSPSPQFTTSSSPWSASTAATTPLSWSSASPNVAKTISTSSKRSHTVPVPANVKSRLPKLPVLKESQHSTISNTVQGPEPDRAGRATRRTPDPAPPPRSTSLKGKRTRNNSTTTHKSDRQEPKEQEAPRPAASTVVAGTKAPPTSSSKEPQKAEKPKVTQGHSRLQEALNATPQLATSRMPTQDQSRQDRAYSAEPPRPRQLLEPLPIAKNQHRRFPSLSRRHARNPSSSEPENEKPSARSRLAKFSRLALFGRSKNNTDVDTKLQVASTRKGPAAGTGHEGYGKFGRRGRKQSMSSGSIAATDSETSITSVTRKPAEKRQSRISGASHDQSDLDDFASTRMKPVVMLGGSQRGRANPFPPLPQNPQLSDVSLSTLSSAENFPALTRPISPRRERFPPDNEDPRPTLATRRSQKFARTDETFHIPEPIETQGLTATPALDSRNTTQSSEVATPASAMYRIDPSLLEKQRNKSRRLKWNIFRRKDSMSETEDRPVERPATRPGMSVNVAPVPTSRPIPYYAMLGAESEATTTTTIGQFLREAQESPEREDELISVGMSDDEVTENPYSHRESVLLPSAPLRPAPTISSAPDRAHQSVISTPQEQFSVPEPLEFPVPARRQPRLAQVGRIPKVVSTRQQIQPGVSVAQVPISPILESPNVVQPKVDKTQLPRLNTRQPLATRPKAPNTTRNATPIPESNIIVSQETKAIESEFLDFSDTRNSDFTTSSDSTGIISIIGPPLSRWSSANQRRIDSMHHDDEIWHEYNDFMDDIMSPVQQTKSPSKHKKLNQPVRAGSTGRVEAATESIGSKGLAITHSTIPAIISLPQSYDTPSLILPVGPSLQEMASSEEIRLRRSRIIAELHASYAPSSPFSMGGLIDEYGRPGSGKFSDRLSGFSAPSLTPTQAFVQPHRERLQQRQYESAAHLEEIERTKNPTRHSDRQYASLMVSRWLSFGRVLFSPAHQEIVTNPQRHVLVIDGLGNEDWSIYCAVTYQSQNAFVHDLKEKRNGKNKPKAVPSSTNAPPNHRRSEVSSFNDKFPFPPGFFCAIVVRFPPAMPDSKLKNIISECRRVLSAGGYLELMVLDLDIVNMGVQTRRAIKDLKIKMSTADRSISLKPIIDNVQTVLGSNGFPQLSRCVVGVPVVGKPATSLDSSSESRSSSGSTAGHKRRSLAGPRPYGSLGGQANFSLNDLVADYSANADAKIGRMVSRTARSWWQHCFEAGIITESNTAKSVLSSKEVLNECKTRAANFKLLIAYTQKPPHQLEQKRRTMSEPTVPTLATAGTARAPM